MSVGRGKAILEVLNDKNLVCVNDGRMTRVDIRSGKERVTFMSSSVRGNCMETAVLGVIIIQLCVVWRLTWCCTQRTTMKGGSSKKQEKSLWSLQESNDVESDKV